MQARYFRGFAALLMVGLLAPTAARAQAQKSGTRFGVEGAFATNNDVGIGAGASFKFHLAELSNRPITGRVTFDYFFPSSSHFGGFTTHFWEIAADGMLDITTASSKTKPYVAAGLTYGKWSYGGTYCPGCSASNTELHLAGGFNFMGDSKLMPFVEAKIELGNGSEFIIKGGVHFK